MTHFGRGKKTNNNKKTNLNFNSPLTTVLRIHVQIHKGRRWSGYTSTKPGSGHSINAYHHFSPLLVSRAVPKHWLHPSRVGSQFPIPDRLGLAVMKGNLVAQGDPRRRGEGSPTTPLHTAAGPLGWRSRDPSHRIPVTYLFRPQIWGGRSPRPSRQPHSRRRDTGDACAEPPASHPPGPSARKGNNTPSERQAG